MSQVNIMDKSKEFILNLLTSSFPIRLRELYKLIDYGKFRLVR